jgi:hypothetical protein
MLQEKNWNGGEQIKTTENAQSPPSLCNQRVGMVVVGPCSFD